MVGIDNVYVCLLVFADENRRKLDVPIPRHPTLQEASQLYVEIDRLNRENAKLKAQLAHAIDYIKRVEDQSEVVFQAMERLRTIIQEFHLLPEEGEG